MHKVCRDCGEEYRLEIERCADCGGELELAREGEAPGGEDVAADAQLEGGPGLELRALTHALRAGELRPAADLLAAAGVPFAIRTGSQGFELVVPHAHMERAVDVTARLLGLEEQQAAPERCPACETALPEAASECPECGLALSLPDEPED